jgi:hypothetical protein
MVRRSGFENSSLLDRVGRSTTRLTIDDVGEVLGDAMRAQRQQILSHVDRLFRLQEVTANNDARFKNLHRRLIEIEADIRALKRGGSR